MNDQGEKELSEENLRNRWETAAFAVRAPKTEPSIYNGPYRLGMNLYPAYFVIVDGEVVINNPYELYYNGGEAQQKHDAYMKKLYEDGTANYRQPRFLLSDSEMSEISASILDYAQNYTINAIGGEMTQETAKANLESQCNSRGISRLYDYMREQREAIYGNN